MFRLYRPLLTLAKIWLACDTPTCCQRGAELLDQLQKYTESTHKTTVLIEVLLLQAIRQDTGGDETSALRLLEKAIELAEPGGFVRLFVDLGPPVTRLLNLLHRQGVSPNYIGPILTSYPSYTTDDGRMTEPSPSSPLVDPLTSREMEVLELLAQRLTNKEIAERLIISPGTVKTHGLNLYAKLGVHGRQQAVERARELSLLSIS